MKKTDEKYIYITKEGKYRVQIRPNKKIKEKFDKTFDTLEEAIEERDKFLARQRLGLDKNVNKKITFWELCDLYFEWFKNKPKKPSPNTVKDYAGRIRSLKRYFKEDQLLYKISSADIELFLSSESERQKIDPNHLNIETNKKISSNTLHHEYVMLRILFNKALKKWKIISENPMDGVEEPKLVIEKEVEHIPYERFEETIDIIEKYATVRDKAIFYLGLCGGLREEEVCGLHCESEDDPNSDIDFIENKVFINHAVKQNYETKEYEEYDLKSNYSYRGIPLPQMAINSIKEYLKYREQFVKLLKIKQGDKFKNLPNLFLNKDGDYFRPRYVGKLWNKFAKKYNISVTFHGLRHTFITYQMNYNDELTASEVQALAGHSNISTTYKYVHKSEEKLKKATKVFDNPINNRIDINDDNTIFAPIMHLASVITGVEYVEIGKIIELLKNINPTVEINYNNLSDNISQTRNYLLANYPSLENMTTLNQKYTRDEFEEKVRNVYGNKYLLEVITNEKEYLKC